MKMTISIDIEDILKKPVDEIDDQDQETLDEAKSQLPRKVVKLGKDEDMMDPGANAKPLVHVVKKGETLKDIAEKYMISYGELSNHLMNTEGTTSIHEGMEIKIPRYFIDLSKAE